MTVAVGQQTFPAPLPDVRTIMRGRTEESAMLHDLVLDPSVHAVTITGPGGVGKTRLAIHVANGVASAFEGDVAFVSLAAIRQVPLVMLAIGQSLGFVADPGAGYDDALIGWLRERRILLVLDNLEQVLDATPALQCLVDGCPSLTILSTSQVALNLRGERVFPLAPLPTPDPGAIANADLAASDTVALFMDRAREVAPGFTPSDDDTIAIARLCTALDGLPLAIELAAARANLLSPQTMMERIDNRLEMLGQHRGDVPDRLRTLRAAIAWSYDLLDPGEQALFRQLAVFEAGISLEGAAHVAGDERYVACTLRTLAARNLLYVDVQPHGRERYQMLQTIRAFGIEQLRERGEEEDARRAHADYIVWLAEQAEPHLVTASQVTWMERLDRERENIRAVVEWALAGERNDIVFRIVGAVWRFLATRGLGPEGRTWMRRALSGKAGMDVSWRAKAMVGAGHLAEDARDMAAAEQMFMQAHHLATAIGERETECHSLIGLANVELGRADFPSSKALNEKALALAREIGDRRSATVALGNLGGIAFQRGSTEDAIRSWQEASSYLHELGDRASESAVLMNIGSGYSHLGRYEEAMVYLTRALHIQRSMKSRRDLTFTLMNIGDVATLMGEFDRAREALDETDSLLQDLDAPDLLAIVLMTRARIALMEDDEAACANIIIDAMRIMENGSNTLVFIEAGLILAQLCARRGMAAEAVALLHGADETRQRIQVEYTPLQRKAADDVQRVCKQALDPSAYQAAAGSSRGMDDEAFSRRISSIARQVIGRQHAGTVLPLPDSNAFALTPRELDVLREMATGKSTRDMATALDISAHTVTTHTRNILAKMEVNSRAAAVALAASHGVISLSEER
jgi:predicted ATPase/DNA-binding CsgD family transcriptional regulator/Tfp pilus assembly protein PilF